MLTLNCKIIIHEVNEKGLLTNNEISIDFVNQVEIESSWKEFTDIATITLPRNIVPAIKEGVNSKTEVSNVSKKTFRQHLQLWAKYHPHIEIYLGYNGRENLAFKGIVRDVKGGVPVTLTCEDDMYHFKTKMITYSSKEASLKSIVDSFGVTENAKKELIHVDFEEEKLGAFITEEPMTPVQVLEKLKDDFGIYSFIRYDKDGKSHLVIGKEYEINHGSNVSGIKTKFGGNFIFHHTIIEDDLEYKFKEDIKVKVTYVAKGIDENDEVKATYPDKDANKDQFTGIDTTGLSNDLDFFLNDPLLDENQPTERVLTNQSYEDLSEEAEELTFYIFEHDLKKKMKDGIMLGELKEKLRKMAKRRLEIMKYNGFRGGFTSFGDVLSENDDPKNTIGGFVKHGDYIQLREQFKRFDLGVIKRNQNYFVDAVTYSFGESGFRQQIQLGREKS
ncbi:hypothetical protein [Tenacibaculum agarivorans]|uniref:hypothetical protein n=1 Tax=Tenacibaculum agarivorans TaxID=1908389 RepID=UPI00094BA30A|nr:hypothetical protein [Tenacibaculum agarivorans]